MHIPIFANANLDPQELDRLAKMMTGIKQSLTEPYSPFQNRAQVNIHELKKYR
jgi:hypothetical protein